MLNFAVGPVQSFDEAKWIGAQDVPYFRTPEFSETMLENEQMVNQLVDAPEGSRTVFVTGSGTASMEAVVMGTLSPRDKALVVNGGSFGKRFVELCELHAIPFEEIALPQGTPLTSEHLAPYEGEGFTAFLVNIHETSTGILYDKQLISDFCTRNGLFLIVDAISSFLADPLSMSAMNAQVVFTGSQKSLACAPGVSLITLSPEAIDRVRSIPVKCMYLDLNLLLDNGVRGQTPFTPAVGILLQINSRLKTIMDKGLAAEIARVHDLAEDFRARVAELPVDARLVSPSNASTYLTTRGFSAQALEKTLKDEYGIWICPNGGANADTSFRVGHIGNLTKQDNTTLLSAMHDVIRRGLLV